MKEKKENEFIGKWFYTSDYEGCYGEVLAEKDNVYFLRTFGLHEECEKTEGRYTLENLGETHDWMAFDTKQGYSITFKSAVKIMKLWRSIGAKLSGSLLMVLFTVE